MKLKNSSGNFEPAPEYVGSAVCVDVTPLKIVQTQFGPKEKFRFVYELNLEREDGTRYCVWSQPFTPSYHENSALRPYMKKWQGKELTAEEQRKFDIEDLVGRPAHLTVIHEHSEGEVYSNIALIQPDKASEPLQPSGKYVRVKDRPPKDGPAQGGYRPTEQPAVGASDLGATKVHAGKCKGMELRDLSVEQVQALVESWLPSAKANPKPTADDKRLIVGLEWWVSAQPASDDNVPY